MQALKRLFMVKNNIQLEDEIIELRKDVKRLMVRVNRLEKQNEN